MSPERWKKIEEVFQAVVDLAPEERLVYLGENHADDEDLIAEVKQLVADYEASDDFIESPVWTDSLMLGSTVRDQIGDSLDAEIEKDNGSMIGRQLGVYRLSEELGRGGMGAVYLAERSDGSFRQRVALKIIKRGMDTDFIVRRFRIERQILATLSHPYITRLLDGGTTDDGRPFFVMDYIAGLPLYRFADENRLTINERLKLFVKICEAVEYAHQNLIIHRDLKPSNILVAKDGSPRLLDFGIAKLLDPELSADTLQPTATAMRMMTVDYASPEQIRGEQVTFATDIYSLGVILFELLTGHRPYRFANRTPHEIARVICEETPLLPSEAVTSTNDILPVARLEQADLTVERLAEMRKISPDNLEAVFRGNLDSITLKALSKSPAGRYQSVQKFREDLEKHLAGNPVSAPVRIRKAKPPTLQPETNGKVIAVLPLKLLNFSEDANTGENYLTLGLADAMITRLSRIKGLTVRPTSSIVRFADKAAEITKIAEELGVDYVLDGRLKKFGKRLRVTVQLLDAAHNSTVWAETIDETIDDVLQLEDSICFKVLRSLTPQLTGEELSKFEKRGTSNPKAYEAYLRGRFHWHSYTVEGISKALVSYYEAIAEDENFALPYSGVADYYNFLSIFGVMSPEESFPAAKQAAEKAIALDENLAEAYTSLGITAYGYDWDFPKAQKLLEKSLQLNPNSAETRLWYGYLFGIRGEHEKAVAEFERAEKLNPQSPSVPVSFALTLRNARQFEKGREKLYRALEIQPANPTALQGFCWFVNFLKNDDEAEAMCRKAVEVSERQNLPLYAYAYTLACVGKEIEAREIVEELKMRGTTQYVPPIYFALIHTALREKDVAFEWLEKCFEVRDFWVIWLPIDPRFDDLRDDQRFAEFCKRVKPLAKSDEKVHQSQIETKIFTAEEKAEVGIEAARPNFLYRHRFKFAFAGILSVLILIGFTTGVITVDFQDRRFELEAKKSANTRNSVAVLPFKNETANPENDFLCDGLSENLINSLQTTSTIRVLPRTASFKYKSVAPQEAGAAMQVDAVLSGKLIEYGENVEIYVEMIDVKTGAKIAGTQYRGKNSELIALENRIAADAARQFKTDSAAQNPIVAKSFTENPQAFEFYLKGEYHRQKATAEEMRQSIEFYKKALELDPNYALAYQGLALSYRTAPAYGILAPQEAYPLAKEAATKALAIDPQLGSANIPLASIKFVWDWDFAGAETEYKRAIQLAPNNPEAHYSYGNFLVAMGRSEEALNELKIAQQFDPLSPTIGANIAWALYIAGRFNEAEAQAKQVLTRDPNFTRVYMNLGEIYLEQGRFDESIAAFEKYRQNSDDPVIRMILGHAYAVAGRKTEALKVAADLEAKVLRKEVSPFLPAVIYAGLGDKDKAFYWLERAFQERSNWLTLTKVGHRLKSLRVDPRYDDLLKRIGFSN